MFYPLYRMSMQPEEILFTIRLNQPARYLLVRMPGMPHYYMS